MAESVAVVLAAIMEDRGLVARRRSADDGRRVEVLASAQALTLFERFR